MISIYIFRFNLYITSLGFGNDGALAADVKLTKRNLAALKIALNIEELKKKVLKKSKIFKKILVDL